MSGPSLPPSNDDADDSAPARARRSVKPDAMPPTQAVVPDYDLLRRIGHGAYGDVWLARSQATGAQRAAKIVWRQSFENDRPFRREFEGIQRFEKISRENPSQLALFHIGRNEAQGYFYYVMELADDASEAADVRRLTSQETEVQNPKSGKKSEPPDVGCYTAHTLRADLDQGRLPAAKVLEIGLALTEALSHLHANGLVHRDVKPSNVIFVNGRPKLADIGLVTDASDQCSIVGTEGYLPPEGPGTPQADIFALGKVLYETATGLDRRAFPDFPPDVRSWPDAVQVFELNEIILKACAKDSGQRYANAESMLGELRRLGGGKSVRQARRAERGWRLVRRGAAWLTATAAVLALVVVASRVRQTPNAVHVEKHSTNELANHFYNLGKTYFDTFEGKKLQMAADCFRRATNADPNFAQAYGYLAATYFWAYGEEWNDLWKYLPRAREVALQALKIDDSVAEAHLALGWYHALKEWAWKDAEKEYKRALEINPSSAFCHLSYAEFLRVVGRTSEALKQITEAKTKDDKSRIINIRLADYLTDARRFEEALEQVEHVLAVRPNGDTAYTEPNALRALNRYPDAIEAERKYRTMAGEPKEKLDTELGELKRAIEAEGPKAYWRRSLELGRKENDTYALACDYGQLGEIEAAFVCLEKCVKERDVALTFAVMTDWRLDPLRSDPRFHAILKTMHLE